MNRQKRFIKAKNLQRDFSIDLKRESRNFGIFKIKESSR